MTWPRGFERGPEGIRCVRSSPPIPTISWVTSTVCGVCLTVSQAWACQFPTTLPCWGAEVLEIDRRASGGGCRRNVGKEAAIIQRGGRVSTFMGTPLMPDMPVAGAFPWLRQGWSLLEDESPSELIIDGLTELQGELKASPFLTLTAKGGEDLKTMIEEA